MKNFTINDMERFSGIKAHTLRIWERRYSTTQPERSGGNSRIYTLDELKKILNISLLKNNGYKISVLSKISSEDIEARILRLSIDHIKWQKAINELTINMYAMEPGSIDKILDDLLVTWNIDLLVENIIYPFLNMTGLLWKGNKLPEEHLVVTAIRKKLMFAIESTAPVTTSNKTALLFLPDSKQLDLGLLYCNYYLKQRGIKVLYMGNDVTLDNLKSIFRLTSLSCLFTYLPKISSFPLAQLTGFINANAPYCKLIVGQYHSNSTDIKNEDPAYMNFKKALDFLYRSCM